MLKAAGVVDAGGAGFVLLLDALLHVADGRPLPDSPDLRSAVPGPTGLGWPAPVAGPAGRTLLAGLRYEVMYLLEAPDESIPPFREVWAGLGDSIVVVGGDGLWNCHIHTDDIGAAIEAALEAGRPRRIRVSDLWEQVEEERWVREAAGTADRGRARPGAGALRRGGGLHRRRHPAHLPVPWRAPGRAAAASR